MSNETETMTAAAEATAPATEVNTGEAMSGKANLAQDVAAAQATAQPEGLTTASSPWAMKAAALGQNADLHVQTTDPQFDGQSVPVVFLEPKADEEDGVETVRLSFKTEAELKDTEGNVKAPGQQINPFPRTLRVPADADAKLRDRLQKDLRSLALDLQGVGVLPRRKDPTLREIYNALGQLEGKRAVCAFTTVKGSKRGDDGQFKTFQNYRFAPAGGVAEGNGAAATAATSNGGDY